MENRSALESNRSKSDQLLKNCFKKSQRDFSKTKITTLKAKLHVGSFSSCMTLGKLLNSSELQFPLLDLIGDKETGLGCGNNLKYSQLAFSCVGYQETK